ncbi:MAG: ATP-binding protein [Candidatus Aenigmarchaeota archaeon]|nr:ATP-binding protein [Candidatus Aenigmarchaeota archaeon]
MEYYPRKIEEKLDEWLKRPEAILIKGPRQSGKTTLLLHLKEKLNGSYVTLEDEDALKTIESAPKEFADRYIKNGENVLLIDEAQYCKDVGKKLKLIYDIFHHKLKLIVTGSGSFDVKVEVGKHLVGRAIYFELLPLNFEEFLMWKAKDLHKIFLSYKESVKEFVLKGKPIEVKQAFPSEFSSLLHEYITFGGFPAVVKESDEEIKKELLKNLVRTFIEKDVFFFLGVRHLEKFQSLLKYLSFNNASLIEFSSIMRELKMDYRTLENYTNLLSATYIITIIFSFHKSLSTELKKARKVYFLDTGLRNSIINNFLPLESRTDKGSLLENFVLNELKANFGDNIRYWRTTGKAEVDFVLTVGENIIPIEVKSEPKLRKGFLSFLNTYKPDRALVVTERDFKIQKLGKTLTAFIPCFYL